jgi:LysR family transcriptional regulator, glycine cleavage system transcriptional activator
VRRLVARVDRLQRLAVFEAAARLGSFSAAADELGMTQPAVTRQIRALEGRLGVDLFVRTSNRSTPSELGARLHGHVAAGFDVIEAGLSELAEHVGTFVLAAHPGIAQQWLVPRLDGLTTALGDLELRLWLFDRDAEVDGGGFDAAIRVGNGDFPGQRSHLLFREAVVPVASPVLAGQWGLDATSSAADVYAAPFVHMDDGDHPWMTWADWLSNFGITLRRQPGRVLFHNYPMVLQQALAGRGIALGWRYLIDDLVAGHALSVVGPEATSHRGYYVTWPDGEPTDAVRALIAWLDEQVAPQPPVG